MEKENIKQYDSHSEAIIQNEETIERLSNINKDEFLKTGKQKYFYNLSMGCAMNVNDSEKLSGMLTIMGYKETMKETEADFIIYNTCCVRENAELKVYGKLGWLKHYKELNPNLIIALCGCMMQQDTVIDTIKKKYRHVDIVFGTFNLYKLPELIEARLSSNAMIIDIWKEQKEIIEDLPKIRKQNFKASVNIMYGCNNFCSYCIVPYVRGRERSRETLDILGEVRKLVSEGVKEITLLGQNVNSYGKNLENPVSFSELLRMINNVEGLKRLSFMTSHPKDMSDELILAMKECEKVGAYLHLPVQSGSTEILDKMNRKYTKESYLELIKKIRKEIPDMAISTDIIVGFPGETESDFLDTLEVIKEARYSTAFTFLYSKRTGTPAAMMENVVPIDTQKDRFDRMLLILNEVIHEVGESYIDNVYDVLVEGQRKQNSTILTGRTPHNSLVYFEGPKNLIGEIIPVKIIENKTFYFIGERI